MICREYAYVAIGCNPYDAKLEELNSMLTDKIKSLEAYYEEESKYAAEIKKALNVKDAPAWEKMILNAKGKRSKVKKLGEALLEKKGYITKLCCTIEQAYNREAALVYDCNILTKEIHKVIDAYEGQLKVIEPKINDLYGLHKDRTILNDHIEKVINQRGKQEETELTETERCRLTKYLEAKGEEEIKNLCTKYMQIKNDRAIAKNLIDAYEPMIEKYNVVAESFAELRERTVEQLTQVRLTINNYKMITRNELNLLEEMELPDNFISAVNNLAKGVEDIDKEFAQRLLNVFVDNNKNNIKKINLDNIVHGLIKAAKSDENE